MSIKNQSRLPIFASLIIGVTIALLFALNLVVDKISKIKPPSMAQNMPPPPGMKPVVQAHPNAPAQPDDEYKSQRAPKIQPGQGAPGSDGVMRRAPSGKNGADMPKSPPPPQPTGGAKPPTGAPPQPQGQPGMPYPPGAMQMSPEERDAMEREMERRRQMMQEYQDYGPQYYPPPPDFYPNPYDSGYYDDYEDNDYDPGYRGKLEEKNSIVRLSEEEEEDEEFDPDDYRADDYLRDDEED